MNRLSGRAVEINPRLNRECVKPGLLITEAHHDACPYLLWFRIINPRLNCEYKEKDWCRAVN